MTTESDFSRLEFDATVVTRRTADAEMLHLLKELFVEVRSIRHSQESQAEKLSAHIKAEEAMFTHAFPDGDPDGHRVAHEAWIRRAEAQADFWEKLRGSVFTWGVVGLLGVLGLALWQYFLGRIK
jgi:hypothetical protein